MFAKIRELKSLTDLVTELESYLADIDKKNEAISRATVGWHVEHSLLSMVKMIAATEHSDPSLYQRQFNIKRLFVLTTGQFPRGVAKAPESVRPGEVINLSTILPLLEKAKQKVVLFEQLASDKYFTHPVFGDLRLKEARQAIAIHTAHHIKIIKDILSK